MASYMSAKLSFKRNNEISSIKSLSIDTYFEKGQKLIFDHFNSIFNVKVY